MLAVRSTVSTSTAVRWSHPIPMTPPPDSIRLVPELCAVHLERTPQMTAAVSLYCGLKYDLDGLPIPPEHERVSILGAARRLFSAQQRTLELPEPLWMRFLPAWLLLSSSWRFGALVARRRRRTVVHAMELTPLPRLLGGRRPTSRVTTACTAALLGLVIRSSVDRICFASGPARDLYHSLPFVAGVEYRTILELPSPGPGTASRAVPSSVAFAGLLADRSGVHELMRAWPAVEQARPDAHLVVLGGGPLLEEVRSWAALAPSSRSVLGQVTRDEVLSHFARTQVVVAPSVPDGRWTEQIGLPIKEGLAVGATVVTTAQTGLAPWLEEHGHVVLPVDGHRVPDLTAGLLRAINAPLPRADVIAALPAVDGRIESDRWLHDVS